MFESQNIKVVLRTRTGHCRTLFIQNCAKLIWPRQVLRTKYVDATAPDGSAMPWSVCSGPVGSAFCADRGTTVIRGSNEDDSRPMAEQWWVAAGEGGCEAPASGSGAFERVLCDMPCAPISWICTDYHGSNVAPMATARKPGVEVLEPCDFAAAKLAEGLVEPSFEAG